VSSSDVPVGGADDARPPSFPRRLEPKADAVAPGGELPALPGRKPYQAPRLIVHGSVRELTLGGQGASPDAASKKKAKVKSDPSVKQNVVRIGTHPLGIGLYLFEYKPGFRPAGQCLRHFGVMADEVEQAMPEAVSRDRDGIRHVRHDLLGISDLAQQLVP
jgi:hypothetical protein